MLKNLTLSWRDIFLTCNPALFPALAGIMLQELCPLHVFTRGNVVGTTSTANVYDSWNNNGREKQQTVRWNAFKKENFGCRNRLHFYVLLVEMVGFWDQSGPHMKKYWFIISFLILETPKMQDLNVMAQQTTRRYLLLIYLIDFCQEATRQPDDVLSWWSCGKPRWLLAFPWLLVLVLIFQMVNQLCNWPQTIMVHH